MAQKMTSKTNGQGGVLPGASKNTYNSLFDSIEINSNIRHLNGR